MQARRTNEPTVYVVLPVHNRRAVTGAFCDCLARQTYTVFLLILVDDGSTDGTAELVAGYPFRKQICRGDGNLWWAGGLRRGMARLANLAPAPDDVVLLVNDDTSFDDDFLEKAVLEIGRAGDPAMLSVPVLFRDSGKRAEGGFVCDWPHFTFRDYGRHPEKIDCASTRCLFVRYGDLTALRPIPPGTAASLPLRPGVHDTRASPRPTDPARAIRGLLLHGVQHRHAPPAYGRIRVCPPVHALPSLLGKPRCTSSCSSCSRPRCCGSRPAGSGRLTPPRFFS